LQYYKADYTGYTENGNYGGFADRSHYKKRLDVYTINSMRIYPKKPATFFKKGFSWLKQDSRQLDRGFYYRVKLELYAFWKLYNDNGLETATKEFMYIDIYGNLFWMPGAYRKYDH